MKSTLIISAVATGVLAAQQQPNPNNLKDIAARDIDPTTMDPVRYSVLSVLHTALPSGEIPIPTGNSEPEWYQNLPSDVKSLLPSLYPAAVPASSSPAAASSAPVPSSPVTVYSSPPPAPSSTPAPYTPIVISSIAPPAYQNSSTPISLAPSSSPKSNITRTVHLTQTLSVGSGNGTAATSTSTAFYGGGQPTPGASGSTTPGLSNGAAGMGVEVGVMGLMALVGMGMVFV